MSEVTLLQLYVNMISKSIFLTWRIWHFYDASESVCWIIADLTETYICRREQGSLILCVSGWFNNTVKPDHLMHFIICDHMIKATSGNTWVKGSLLQPPSVKQTLSCTICLVGSVRIWIWSRKDACNFFFKIQANWDAV